MKAGSRLGNFEILGPIGSGGMGQVFRARDLELGRLVAIKVLKPEIAQNSHLLQRFRRESKILASLNHAHIAQIYGMAEGVPTAPGSYPTHGLVLELVEGDTLEDRIRKNDLRMREALSIAGQIADALEAAHSRGIVHRDLKPANVKITSSGAVKVLDFGIAQSATEADGVNETESLTVAGTIVGTPGYMSPEQIRGQRVDKQTDVWAFGCVLYELLTGQPAFGGATDADMLGVILQRDPDWSRLPSAAPADVSRLLRRCLSKEPSERLRDMGDIRVWIDEALAAPDSSIDVRRARWRHMAPWMVAGIALFGFAVLAASAWRQPAPRVSRLQVLLPAGSEVSVGYNDRDLAITPDGSKLVYVGNDGFQLFVRPLDSYLPLPVHTGGRPFGPFVSPDGNWIGFVEGAMLKKVAVTGGPAVTLATLDAGMPSGATWAPDGSIILAGENAAIGLQRVADSGGQVEVLTRPDRAQGEADHLWPEMLPGGRFVLFTITALTGDLEAAQIAILDLQTRTYQILRRGGSHAHYLPSGHLAYGQAGALQAVAFDLGRLEIRGTPMTVIPDVATSSRGGINFVAADNGTMAYLSAGTAGGTPRTLVWVDREGRETPTGMPPRPYFQPALSPDETRVAVYANDEEEDIWLWDLNGRRMRRLTDSPARDGLQVWSPDGRSVIFYSEREQSRSMFSQPADGAGAAEQLLENPSTQYPMDVSPDGGQLIFTDESSGMGIDLLALELDGSRRVTALVRTRFNEMNGTVSPDGRWLAYQANDSGRYEIYVRPYPSSDGGATIVSTAGGTQPIWTREGQELIYVAESGALMRVEVSSGPAWSATQPAEVVREGYFTNTVWWGRSYDVSRDGEKFLLIKEEDAAPTGFFVVQNWFAELARLLPN